MMFLRYIGIVSSCQTLVQVNGDVDAAIEFLIAEQGMEECSAEKSNSPPRPEASCGSDCSIYY